MSGTPRARVELMRFRSLLVTADTKQALERADEHAKKYGYILEFTPEEGPQPPPYSMENTGRQVGVRLSLATSGTLDATQRIAVVWSILVPFGFTPWTRYPLPGDHSHIFHFLGPWSSLQDRMLSEGRGHLTWPSLCVSAQLDVGAWEGGRATERFVQAQLHRIGYNPGAVDGIIGNRTLQALRALGAQGRPLTEVATQLAQREVVRSLGGKAVAGQIRIPGRQVSVETAGGITAEHTGGDVRLQVSDVGTVIVRVGQEL